MNLVRQVDKTVSNDSIRGHIVEMTVCASWIPNETNRYLKADSVKILLLSTTNRPSGPITLQKGFKNWWKHEIARI